MFIAFPIVGISNFGISNCCHCPIVGMPMRHSLDGQLEHCEPSPQGEIPFPGDVVLDHHIGK